MTNRELCHDANGVPGLKKQMGYCKDCFWWDRPKGHDLTAGYGYCRYNPPYMTAFPMVNGHVDWCRLFGSIGE